MGRTSSITMPWWGSWVARWLQTKKCDAFFIIFVTFWIYEVCDNGNATKQCNFQNNYGTVEYRMVCSLLYFVLGLLIMMCDLTCDRRSSKFALGLFITICTIRKPLPLPVSIPLQLSIFYLFRDVTIYCSKIYGFRRFYPHQSRLKPSHWVFPWIQGMNVGLKNQP